MSTTKTLESVSLRMQEHELTDGSTVYDLYVQVSDGDDIVSETTFKCHSQKDCADLGWKIIDAINAHTSAAAEWH